GLLADDDELSWFTDAFIVMIHQVRTSRDEVLRAGGHQPTAKERRSRLQHAAELLREAAAILEGMPTRDLEKLGIDLHVGPPSDRRSQAVMRGFKRMIYGHIDDSVDFGEIATATIEWIARATSGMAQDTIVPAGRPSAPRDVTEAVEFFGMIWFTSGLGQITASEKKGQFGDFAQRLVPLLLGDGSPAQIRTAVRRWVKASGEPSAM
ncbi:MAG TPA: hypothetical protein VIL69_11135, partial [Roseomonas sp.]